jgi:hypothetical protein
MSFKVYNFRYNRGTKPGSVRDVLVDTANDGKYRITGYDRLADSYEGGLRKFDKDQMTGVVVYEVTRIIECKDEKSAMELENLGGYDRFGSNVVISKKMVLEANVLLCGKAERGYVKIQYGTASVDLPLSGGNGIGFVFSGSAEPKSTFENVITRLYNEIQKNK